MKITLGQLAESYQAWKKLGSHVNPSVETRYRLIRVAKVTEPQMKIFEEQQLIILMECGVETQIPGNYNIKLDCKDKFESEMNKLKAIEINVPGEKFSLESIEPAKLSALDVVALDWLIILPEDPVVEKTEEE
jgi:hypothetical protein